MCFIIPLFTRCGPPKTTSKYPLRLLPRKKESVASKIFRSLSGLISADKMSSGKGHLEPFLSPNTQGGRTEIQPRKVKRLLLRNFSEFNSSVGVADLKE